MPNSVIGTMEQASGSSAPGALTLSRLRKDLYDAIGKSSVQWQRSADDVINDALNRLVLEHEWKWRRKFASLATVADQDYIELPADFSVLLTLRLTGSSDVQMTTEDELLLYRTSNPNLSTLPGGYMGCIKFASQATTSVTPRARLELWPTPAATTADAFLLAYHRLIAPLTDQDQVPDVPAVHHPLLRQLVREEALRYDDQREAAATEAQATLRMWLQHLAVDGKMQNTGGPIRGALGGYRTYVPQHNGLGFAT